MRRLQQLGLESWQSSQDRTGLLKKMYFLFLLLVAAAAAQSPPPPPPDRIWFRQDSLSAGQTCAQAYEAVAGTPALIKGKDPIILPEDASFKICIKFLSGSYTNPRTGEVTERAGRDWAHDSGRRSNCAEGCCEFQFGSLAKKYISWFPTTSDCSDTALAKEAPLYFQAQAGAGARLCALFPDGEDSAPVWQILQGTAARCVGQCCTIQAA